MEQLKSSAFLSPAAETVVHKCGVLATNAQGDFPRPQQLAETPLAALARPAGELKVPPAQGRGA